MGTQTDDLRAWTQLRMRQRNLSHAQLALKCGLDRSTVTRFLGKDRRPRFDVAMRIVGALYDSTCIPLVDQMHDLLAGPERVEAALRSDPLLHPAHVDEIMRQYFERRAA
ncbi:MAG: helix-turn-helix domain-containing protein [Chloroflexota bacterium]|nr:helix-turn-helix domain-containing protein [Chloroflexota bacterium]